MMNFTFIKKETETTLRDAAKLVKQKMDRGEFIGCCAALFEVAPTSRARSNATWVFSWFKPTGREQKALFEKLRPYEGGSYTYWWGCFTPSGHGLREVKVFRRMQQARIDALLLAAASVKYTLLHIDGTIGRYDH